MSQVIKLHVYEPTANTLSFFRKVIISLFRSKMKNNEVHLSRSPTTHKVILYFDSRFYCAVFIVYQELRSLHPQVTSPQAKLGG